MNMITSIWKHIMKELGMLHTKENNVPKTIPFTDETAANQLTDRALCRDGILKESDATVADDENAGKSEAKEKSEFKRKGNIKEEKERKQPVRLTQEVRAFLQTHYDFRYNLLTDETEYRPAGMRYWFTKEEESEIQRHNTAFYHPCPAEEVLHACFRMAEAEDEGCERLSASDIFRKLKKYNPAAMRGSNPATFAQVLLAAGITRKHTKYGNVYLVKAVNAA